LFSSHRAYCRRGYWTEENRKWYRIETKSRKQKQYIYTFIPNFACPTIESENAVTRRRRRSRSRLLLVYVYNNNARALFSSIADVCGAYNYRKFLISFFFFLFHFSIVMRWWNRTCNGRNLWLARARARACVPDILYAQVVIITYAY